MNIVVNAIVAGAFNILVLNAFARQLIAFTNALKKYKQLSKDNAGTKKLLYLNYSFRLFSYTLFIPFLIFPLEEYHKFISYTLFISLICGVAWMISTFILQWRCHELQQSRAEK